MARAGDVAPSSHAVRDIPVPWICGGSRNEFEEAVLLLRRDSEGRAVELMSASCSPRCVSLVSISSDDQHVRASGEDCSEH